MGRRSRERRARRAWIVPWIMPVLRAFQRWVRWVSPRTLDRLATNVGALFGVLGVTRSIVRRNLEHACGRKPNGVELRAFERAYYKHMALLVLEFLRMPDVTIDQFEPEGVEVARELYGRGEGVIFVAGHAGVWELAGHAAGLAGIPIMSVAKMSGHELIDAWTTGQREAGGQSIRDVRGSLWAMKKTLDRKEAVGINVDQEARQNRVFAPFFGVPAATSSAPALLHLRTGAPVVVVTAHRVGLMRYSLRVFDVIRHPKSGDKEADLLAITTRINAGMEDALRLEPDQWLWSHRRWRRRPEDEAVPFGRDPSNPPLCLSGAPYAGGHERRAEQARGEERASPSEGRPRAALNARSA